MKFSQFAKTKLAKATLMSLAVFAQSSYGALYEVNEVDTSLISRNANAVNMNASGDFILSVNYTTTFPLAEHNIPIDLTLFDFEDDAIVDTLTDPDSASTGDYNLEDYQTLLSFIRALQGSNQTQHLASFLSYVSDNGVVSFIPGLDVEDVDFGGYTKTVETLAQAINDNGVIAGITQAPSTKVLYTNESDEEITYVIQEFDTRGFVDLNGNVVELVSESDLAGGFSQAFDINNNLVVAGVEVINPNETIEGIVEDCQDDDVRTDIPVEVCLANREIQVRANHEIRATVWELDTDGNIVDKTNFGLPVTPADDETRFYSSEAFAINNNGIAVGRATNYFEDNEDRRSSYAAIFDGDDVISITDRFEYTSSQATDINDNNIVIGFANLTINGFARSKFFTHNMETGETVHPEDFFTSSTSIARGINNNGQVVGEGEVETDLIANRRRHGFIYDMNDGTFQNLNDLLSCDSPYTVVQGNDINDAGQIVATAVIARAQRDIQGNIELSDDGSEIIIETLTTVLLNPIPGGQIEDCAPPPTEVQERQGGSLGFWALLFAGIGFVRRFSKKA